MQKANGIYNSHIACFSDAEKTLLAKKTSFRCTIFTFLIVKRLAL